LSVIIFCNRHVFKCYSIKTATFQNSWRVVRYQIKSIYSSLLQRTTKYNLKEMTKLSWELWERHYLFHNMPFLTHAIFFYVINIQLLIRMHRPQGQLGYINQY
jgi:hypothetical protein